MCIIDNDFYSAEIDPKKGWIIKAKPMKLKKKVSEYKDPPRFKMIIQYENEMKKNYQKSVANMTKDILSKIIEFSK